MIIGDAVHESLVVRVMMKREISENESDATWRVCALVRGVRVLAKAVMVVGLKEPSVSEASIPSR